MLFRVAPPSRRWLSMSALGVSLFAGAFSGALLSGGILSGQSERARFTEIDVERINIVEPDGSRRLVMSNRARFPEILVDGTTIKRSSPGSPGLLFYNDEGDESGGLRFDTRRIDGKVAAGASLLFDQYKQDQTVGIIYDDFDGHRTAGFHVWDRPDASLASGTAAAKGGVRRLFAGKTRERTSSIVLSDAKGKPRLVLSVAANGEAKVEFLDDNGQAIQILTPATPRTRTPAPPAASPVPRPPSH